MNKLRQLTANKTAVAAFLCVLALTNTSCSYRPKFLGRKNARSQPRIRMSCYASSTIGTTFADPERLGLHSYKNAAVEKTGIIYTCKAGHLDIAHLRKAADWTAYFAEKILANLRKDKTEFSFKFYEPSRYFVQISYPQNWDNIPFAEKELAAKEISVKLGQYFAFVGCTWHEILTWFGYRSVPFYPEFPSAFSWEDSFSNVLGTHIAGIALRDTNRKYDDAMTVALYRELKRLGPQPKSVAVQAAERVRGKWFSGDFLFFVDLKGRNFDIGLEDGFITPWLVPSMPQCPDAVPSSYPVPTLYFLAEYGFSVKLEIEPREFQKRKILKIVYPDSTTREKRIEPAVHFAAIMDYIVKDAEKRLGEYLGPDLATPPADLHTHTKDQNTTLISDHEQDRTAELSPIVPKAGPGK